MMDPGPIETGIRAGADARKWSKERKNVGEKERHGFSRTILPLLGNTKLTLHFRFITEKNVHENTTSQFFCPSTIHD